MKKRKAPKCITCGKNLKRNSYRYIRKKEPYKGNMICYNKKKQIHQHLTQNLIVESLYSKAELFQNTTILYGTVKVIGIFGVGTDFAE